MRHFDVENQHFLLKMLRVDLEKHASYIGGEHIFRKIMKQSDREVKNEVEMMLDNQNSTTTALHT